MDDQSALMETTRPVTKFGIFCWALFDWAHNAFPTVIITFVFSTYFTRAIAHNEIQGTADWGWTIAVSGIVVAILAPFLGSISDHTGRRKPWIAFFMLVSVFFTAMLWFATPSTDNIVMALAFVAIANAAYEFTQIFYNSMMVSIAPPKMIGRISGWGWGMGYFGGLVCLIIALVVFIEPKWLGSANGLDVRATTLFVAGWFIVFSIPIFLYTPDIHKTNKGILTACKDGLIELGTTFKEIKNYKKVFLFLLAHLLYTDGLNSIFVFAGVFAAGAFHMTYSQILIFAIVLNITAGIGACAFAFVDDKVGPKFTVCISIIAIVILGIVAVSITSITWFWVVGALLGIFVGPTQAASRSYMARIAPRHLLNQMFGIYQLSGNITAFIGPILVAAFTEMYQSQRVGLSAALGLMFIGLILLLFVPKPQKYK
jgi:UMF1 family MFS transporter